MKASFERARGPKGRRASTQSIKRCAIYTRKSHARGLEQQFNSLHAQRAECELYIRRQPGWEIIATKYDDGGFTGANTNRPGFQQLLDDIEAGQIDVVVVYKVDRLSRSLRDFTSFLAMLERANVGFVSVTQNFSLADAMGRMGLNMVMTFAEFEREMSRDRTRDKLDAMRRLGKWTGGTAPFGYRADGGKLLIDDAEAMVVRETFDLFLEHRSIVEVVRILNERYHRLKRRYTGKRAVHARPWERVQVARILRNPTYIGVLTTADEWHQGEHKAILPRDRFELVQQMLKTAGATTPAGPQNPQYILRGLLRCAGCGASFVTHASTKARVVYRYYYCESRKKRGPKACASNTLPAEAFEDYVVREIRRLVNNGALAHLAADVQGEVRARLAARRAQIGVETRQLPPRIEALREQARGLIETMSRTEGGARELLQEQWDRLAAQLKAAEERLAAAQQDLARLQHVEIDAQWVIDCLSNFDRVWDALTLANRARLMRAVVHRILVNQPRGEVTLEFVDLVQDESLDSPHAGVMLSALTLEPQQRTAAEPAHG